MTHAKAMAARKLRRNSKASLGVDELWSQYARNKADTTLRDELVVRYLPWCDRIVLHWMQSMPKHVSREDGQAVARSVLWKLIEQFEPERGHQFASFAHRRLRGAIMDWLRNTDHVPRLARQKAAGLGRTARRFYEKHGRAPNDEELAEACGLSLAELDRLRIRESVSLQRVLAIGDGGRLLELQGSFEYGKPEVAQLDAAAFERLTRGVPFAARCMLWLYFGCGQTMCRIGEIFSLSESRVSQTFESAMAEIQRRYATRTAAVDALADN